MNIKLISMLVITGLSSFSADAINDKYRQQLERSGCTQVSEMQGCDLNKTQAENAKAGFVSDAPLHDAKVENTPYHAMGKITCAMGDTKLGAAQCDFGVIRGKSGHAEVHITPPGGFERILSFAGDKVTAADSTVTATKNGDEWLIKVNDYEQYQIPEAVIYGG
ncbi:MAG: hypothetical protein ACRCT7_13595 [Shewanella sp.]